jgi:hypothetical protein
MQHLPATGLRPAAPALQPCRVRCQLCCYPAAQRCGLITSCVLAATGWPTDRAREEAVAGCRRAGRGPCISSSAGGVPAPCRPRHAGQDAQGKADNYQQLQTSNPHASEPCCPAPQVELVDELEVRNLDTNGDKPEMVNQLLNELITQVRSRSCQPSIGHTSSSCCCSTCCCCPCCCSLFG